MQVATPRELYEAPNSRWVAGFVGDINLIEGQVVGAQSGHFDDRRRADAGTIVASHEPSPRPARCLRRDPAGEDPPRRDRRRDAATARQPFAGSHRHRLSRRRVGLQGEARHRRDVAAAVANARARRADGSRAGQRVMAVVRARRCAWCWTR